MSEKENYTEKDENIKEYQEEIEIERIRRITGYLTGSVDRWNKAKKAELKDRVKHAGGVCR